MQFLKVSTDPTVRNCNGVAHSRDAGQPPEMHVQPYETGEQKLRVRFFKRIQDWILLL